MNIRRIPWNEPTTEDIAKIAEYCCGRSVTGLSRFSAGLCHYVYDVSFADSAPVVVRVARPENECLLESAVYWYTHLAPLGVRLARIVGKDFSKNEIPFAYLVLERLAGCDLEQVYPEMSHQSKVSLAEEMVAIQRAISSLPPASSFGFAMSYERPGLHQSWSEVVGHEIQRCRARLIGSDVLDAAMLDDLSRKRETMEIEFDKVPPRAFLDDTTTKNVIVDSHGHLSGIVDVDMVCFGDPLFTLALTKAAFSKLGFDSIYVDRWEKELQLEASGLRRLAFYTALFCVNLLSECGQLFNKTSPVFVDQQSVGRLHSLYHRETSKLT